MQALVAMAVDAPLLGTTSLLVLMADYGLYRWLGARVLDDDSHRSALLAAALGLVLSANMVLIAGPSTVAYAASWLPWVMVAFFTYDASRMLALGAGTGAWAVWWTIIAAADWLAGLRAAVA